MSKKEIIKQLEEDLDSLEADYQSLVRAYNQKCADLYQAEKGATAKVKREYAGDISLDFWPPSDWVRLRLDKFALGRYFQLCVGPIRIDFYES